MATTYTGRLLTPTNFGVPSPLDMAVQMGRLPRFAGATRAWPWSVLHHVNACYRYALLAGKSDRSIDMLLLHDAEECATGDIPTTWKTEDIRSMQHRLSEKIFQIYLGPKWGKHGFDVSHRKSVSVVDFVLLVAEMEVVGPPGVLAHSGLDCSGLPVMSVDGAMEIVREVLNQYSDPRCCATPEGELVHWFLYTLRERDIFPDIFVNG